MYRLSAILYLCIELVKLLNAEISSKSFNAEISYEALGSSPSGKGFLSNLFKYSRVVSSSPRGFDCSNAEGLYRDIKNVIGDIDIKNVLDIEKVSGDIEGVGAPLTSPTKNPIIKFFLLIGELTTLINIDSIELYENIMSSKDLD